MNNSNCIFSPTHISSYFLKSDYTYTQCLAKIDKHRRQENQYVVFCTCIFQEEIVSEGFSPFFLAFIFKEINLRKQKTSDEGH